MIQIEAERRKAILAAIPTEVLLEETTRRSLSIAELSQASPSIRKDEKPIIDKELSRAVRLGEIDIPDDHHDDLTFH